MQFPGLISLFNRSVAPKLIAAICCSTLVFFGCDVDSFTPVTNCDNLAPKIIDLSEEKAGFLSPNILKLYEIEQVSKTSKRMTCRADARFSTGNERESIEFYKVTDEEGDSFIGYGPFDLDDTSEKDSTPVSVGTVNPFGPEKSVTPTISPISGRPQPSPTPVSQIPVDVVHIGMTRAEAENVLGLPDRLSGDRWAYKSELEPNDEDWVDFDDESGSVTAWSNRYGSFEVFTGAIPHPVGPESISIGSTKSDALSALGNPVKITTQSLDWLGPNAGIEEWMYIANDDVWYEHSSITFDSNGIVIGWDNSSDALSTFIHISSADSGSDRIKIGVTVGDVLRLQGMPVVVDHAEFNLGENLFKWTWAPASENEYWGSNVLFSSITGLVIGWDDVSGGLILDGEVRSTKTPEPENVDEQAEIVVAPTLTKLATPVPTLGPIPVSTQLVTTNKADTSTKITYISEDWSNIWLCKDLPVESTDLTTGGTQTCSVSTEVVGNNLIITSTGIPNHDFESTLGCCASDQNSVWTIPLEPELSTDEPVMAPERGAVAFTVTGVAIYGPEEGPGGDAVALEYGYFVEDRQEIDLGVCGGHSGPGGEYHYHYDSNCMHWHEDSQGISGYALDIVSSVVSKIIGFAFDGFPIYSTYEEDSSGAVLEMTASYRLKVGEDGYGGIGDYEFVENLGDLDECNGHFGTTPEAPTGMYHYHSTLNNGEGDLGFPYFPLCYKGIVNEESYSVTNGLGGDGPPGGAGRPPGGGGRPPGGG